MTRFTALRLALVVALSAPNLAFGQAANISLGTETFDSGQPVEVSADTLSVDQGNGQAIFDGNVLVVQGEVRLSADLVTVIYSRDTEGAANGIDTLIASGSVTFVTPTDAAEAKEAEYSVELGKVILTGDVLLTQGSSAISGDRLTVDLESGSGQMEGRVRTVFNTGDGN